MLNALCWLWLCLMRGRWRIARGVFGPKWHLRRYRRHKSGELCIFGIRLQIVAVTL
jgi:hypothetical protein